jgi:hypothetical protein
LLQRNDLHSFAPWAQLRQPEKHEMRYYRNGKRKQLAKNCALGANPKCPWNYPAQGLLQTSVFPFSAFGHQQPEQDRYRTLAVKKSTILTLQRRLAVKAQS